MAIGHTSPGPVPAAPSRAMPSRTAPRLAMPGLAAPYGAVVKRHMTAIAKIGALATGFDEAPEPVKNRPPKGARINRNADAEGHYHSDHCSWSIIVDERRSHELDRTPLSGLSLIVVLMAKASRRHMDIFQSTTVYPRL